ncbi:MAG: 4-hydroxythreonine-4-phosphate dehydrogenase PdxA [Thermodesulfobacteriota bacterium]|nr:4-hydroxythreonine-4-phosphate dehydrogenase PdxA [Thermodesulfobacteriota bacterium]
MSASNSPIIGITMGDPAGIGPEIIVKALADPSVYECSRPVVLGDSEVLSSIVLKLSDRTALNAVAHAAEAEAIPGRINLLEISRLKSGSILPGKPTVDGGKAMVAYITRGVNLTLKGELDALVTCPINKALMQRAGHHFEGHTQLIAHLTGSHDYVMMLAGKRLRVSLVTIHCPLKEVPVILTAEAILKTIVITARALVEDFGLKKPCVAVCALNPHAGESGLFGSEEEEIIGPAIEKARALGYSVEGPLPSDTLFFKAASGRFDAVVAMYHDQGLIPLKLLHFSDAVNTTLGLPIIRTSVDHGTAYDIAGHGKADPSSLVAAIGMAAEMIKNRMSPKKG